MLGNRKTAEQISTELSDLIGTDFDPSFVSWLFSELAKHYPDPSLEPTPTATAPAPAASAATVETSHIPVIPLAPRGGGGGRQQPRGGGMFTAAMQGVKRDAREMENGVQGGASQRAKYERPQGQGHGFDGVPAGPRANGGGAGRGAVGGQGQRKGTIFERVDGRNLNGNGQGLEGSMPMAPMGGGAVNPGVFGPGNIAYDGITQIIESVRQGAHASLLASIPFTALASHPHAASLPPALLAQAQAHAMAQAQAFAAMQQNQVIWGQGPGRGFAGPGRGGFQQPQQPHFNPNHRGNQQIPPPPPPPGFNPFLQQPHASNPHAHAPSQPQAPKPVVPVPTKPLLEEICKHGTECSKNTCPYSHPSPVATKESGLVLSSEACEKMLECKDIDCPKSHVSPSILRSPTPASTSTSASASFVLDSTPSAPQPPTDPNSIPGAGEKACKFGAACTRKGCVFLHPWDAREGAAGAGANGGGMVACRWAEACTRADCHFAHPPSRPTPKPASSKSAPYQKSSYSKTNSAPQPPSIGEWPKEEKTHVSERLKRFNLAASGEEEKERIIPGETAVSGNVKTEEGGDGKEEREA